MSVGDVAGLIAALAFVLLVLVATYPLIKLGKVLDETRLSVRGLSQEAMPLLTEVTTTVSITNHAVQVTTNVSALTSLFAATLGSPVIKVAAFTYGVRRALAASSDGRR